MKNYLPVVGAVGGGDGRISGGGGNVDFERLWLNGQSNRLHFVSNLHFGCRYAHLSPNLQLGNLL